MSIGVNELREALDQRDKFATENARLQRVVDDLANGLRDANRRLETIARHAQEEEPDTQQIYNAAYSGGVRRVLDRHGLLRPADRPGCVPESMRAGAAD